MAGWWCGCRRLVVGWSCVAREGGVTPLRLVNLLREFVVQRCWVIPVIRPPGRSWDLSASSWSVELPDLKTGAGPRSAADIVTRVIRRLLEFAPAAGMPAGLFEPTSVPGFIASLPPGAERDAAIAENRAELERRASGLEALADELHELVARHDPAELIPSIAVPAGMGVDDPRAGDDAQRAFSVDAKVEYLVGLALAGPPGTGGVDEATTRQTAMLISSVFDAAEARMFTHSASEHTSGRPEIDESSFLFRLERLYDRMAGYDVHLEEIADEVFEPHRSLYVEELGFCPSDAIRLVRRHTAWVNTEFNTACNAIFEEMRSESIDESAAAEKVCRYHSALGAAYRWSSELLVRSTGIPADQVEAMLRTMSADFGCQPEFRTPLDDNRARRRPLIRLPHGEYLVAVPWSVSHGLHEWLQDHVRENPGSQVAKKYPDHRGAAAERLVSRALTSVFGQHAVFSNQHYDCGDGHGEIDCLVAGSTPIIAEVKSRTLTEQGRRGLRRRVKTVAEEVVTKSFDQTLRARDYITKEGGRTFADRQGGRQHQRLADDLADPIEIVITLERMDPLATAAGKLAGIHPARTIWVTNLADLLMVRDILGDPATFLHYARTRGTATSLGVQAFVEADALGAYLDDRLASLTGFAAENRDEFDEIRLGYNSTDVNQYFTESETGHSPEKPDTGVPNVVLEALRTCAPDYPRAWTTASTAVMAAPPETWKAWRRFLRRHSSERPFHLPCGTASLVASASQPNPELRDETIPLLVVPRQQTTG